jgi:hypothetical protein
VFTGFAAAQPQDAKTPTDVYYLAKSIDETICTQHGLTGSLNKKKISDSIYPRNVYLKLIAVMEEFALIHEDSIDPAVIAQAKKVDMKQVTPGHNFQLLTMMKDYLTAKKVYTETREERKAKTPAEVYQMLRQLSMHHVEIVKARGIKTDWATSGRVYAAVISEILPVVESIVKTQGTAFDPYPFPPQAVQDVVPRYVYKLLWQIYLNMSGYYSQKQQYEPFKLVEVNDCDEITPADVFDMVQLTAAELQFCSGNIALSADVADRYKQWKQQKEKIVPGDVFRLLQHLYILSKRVTEKE